MLTRLVGASLLLSSVVHAGTAVIPEPVTDVPLARAAFADPPASARPFVRWWWPGNAVDDTELTRELEAMQRAGFGGAEIQSFAFGLPQDVQPEVFAYGTEAWFEHVAHAVAEAERLGLTVDLTLGSAWPSGGDHIDDGHSLKQLTMSYQRVTGPGTFDGPVPAAEEPKYYALANELLALPNTYDAGKMRRRTVLAARLAPDPTAGSDETPSILPDLEPLPPPMRLRGGSLVDLTDQVQADGRLRWQIPGGEWVVFAFYSGPTNTRPLYGADPGRGRVLDHLSEDAVRIELDAIAGKIRDRIGERFGTTMQSLFVDSLELRTELFWTEDLFAEFAARRGYRLEPFLPVLFRPFRYDTYLAGLYPDAPPVFELEDAGPRVRQDYERTVSELMVERFFAPVQEWAAANGVTARVQAHGGPVDLLAAYARAGAPDTEGLFAGGTREFVKMASSAAHVNSRPIVGSEVFAFQLRDYMTTPSLMMQEANRHFAAGVNKLVFHGYPYLFEEAFPMLGWMPFSSPYLPGRALIGSFASHLNDRNPFWRFLRAVTDYVARAQVVMRTGRSVSDVAIFQGRIGYPDDPTFREPSAGAVEEWGYSYDYVNEESLLTMARVEGTALRVGAQLYGALILPEAKRVSVDLSQRIAAIARTGVPVIFVGTVPGEVEGYFDGDLGDDIVRATSMRMFGTSIESVLDSEIFQSGAAAFVADPADLGAFLQEDLEIPSGIVLDRPGEPMRYAHRRAGDTDYYFLVNLSAGPLDTTARFPNAAGRLPEIFDLSSGQVATAPMYEQEGEFTRVALHFEPGSAVVLGFERVQDAVHLHFTSFPDIDREEDGSLTGLAPSPGAYIVELGEGGLQIVNLEGPELEPLELTEWDLVAIGVDREGNGELKQFAGFELQDLAQHVELEDFSGTAIYASTFDLPAEYIAEDVRLVLDLGRVYDTAEVRVNDGPARVFVAPPYRMDVTGQLAAGSNRIEIGVTTTLRNMLVGFGEAGEDFFARFAETPLRSPSGLAGPVTVSPLLSLPLDGHTAIEEPSAQMPLSSSVWVPATEAEREAALVSLGEAATIGPHVALRWLWGGLPEEQGDGADVDCATVATFVAEARRLGLDVTLEFGTFVTNTYTSDSEMPGVVLSNPLVPFEEGTFADPEVRAAFLQEVGCLASLEPEFLVIGTEMNLVSAFAPELYEDFVSALTEAYGIVKAISRRIQVGMSYQYEHLRLSPAEDIRNFIDSSGPQDFVGLSSSPGLPAKSVGHVSLSTELEEDYYAWFRQVVEEETPVLFTAVGWPSALPFGSKSQRLFLRRLPALLREVHPVNVFWDVRDRSGSENREVAHSQALSEADGTRKSVWNEVEGLRGKGLLVPAGVCDEVRYDSLPFSVTVVPEQWPRRRTNEQVFRAIGQAAELTDHVSFQLGWKDKVTGHVNDCRSFASAVYMARSLGLHVTVQFNVYEPLPPEVPGDPLEVVLWNPFLPNVAEVGGPVSPTPSLGIPSLRDAYLEQILCIANLRPEYLVLGPEVNFVKYFRPEEFAQFARVYRKAYQTVKAISPRTQVGVSYQYDLLRDDYLAGKDWSMIAEIGPQDFLGLTSYFDSSDPRHNDYPFPTTIPRDYFAPIRERLGGKPIVFTELAWTSFYPDGEESQIVFANRLTELLHGVRPVNAIWPLLHDVRGYFTGLIEAINYSGLRGYFGEEKLIWNEILRLLDEGVFVPSAPGAKGSSGAPGARAWRCRPPA